jgi:hypothetical protein
MPAPHVLKARESGPSLKQEPKNSCMTGLSHSGKAEAETDKSFLVLFSKKNHLLLSLTAPP